MTTRSPDVTEPRNAPPPSARCSSCVHFVERVIKERRVGRCHRFPPSGEDKGWVKEVPMWERREMGSLRLWSMLEELGPDCYPEVARSGWCGEYKPLEDG